VNEQNGKTTSFRTWLDQAKAEAPRTANDIPLIEGDALDFRNAQVAPLIILLADVIEAACVWPSAVSSTHANAA
jgi:hypothetical protein